MPRALLLVDVVKDFEHEDGDRLLASFRERHAGLARAVAAARRAREPVVYANDGAGATGESDAAALVRRALAGQAGDLVRDVVPRPGERFILKPRYSAFDETPLATVLHELGVGEIALAGTATEMCVFQTATDALRRGFDVTVLAGACASVDERHEALALDYLQEVLGITVEFRTPRDG
jgi:nicotinamidase-related amidase